MRQKKHIPDHELERLKESGWSYARLAIRFQVSQSTIRRRLKKDRKKNKEFMTFTQNLAELAKAAPAGYCRKEVMRLVHSLRLWNAMDDESKKAAVLRSIETGARETEEIAGDCNFDASETARILDLLLEAGQILKRPRGGVQNRGRRMKYHFLPVN